jgi:hypothetical protein
VLRRDLQKVIEPDELMAALSARLPLAGASLAGQRAAAGLAGALLRRSGPAARSTIERVRSQLVWRSFRVATALPVGHRQCSPALSLAIPAHLMPWTSADLPGCDAPPNSHKTRAVTPLSLSHIGVGQICGCLEAALAEDDQSALHSTMLVARRVLCPSDYRDLIHAAACRARGRASSAAPAAATGPAAPPPLEASTRVFTRLAAAMRALCPSAPRWELEVYKGLAGGLPREWGAAEAVRAQQGDTQDIIQTCIKDRDAAAAEGHGRRALTMLWLGARSGLPAC